MKHHPYILPPEQRAMVVAKSYPDGFTLDWHYHETAQLVYAQRGVMAVETPNKVWMIPPQRAVWIPPLTHHKVSMHGQAEMRNLYLRPDTCHHFESSCMIHVSSLLRELILHLSTLSTNTDCNDEAERVLLVILDQFTKVHQVPFQLPIATHTKLKSMCNQLLAEPANNRTLNDWAQQTHTSSRTLSRLFRQDMGLSFIQYRQQVRLFAALRLLAKGLPVTSVAMDVGFSSVSAFTHLFKNHMGETPGHFFH